MKKTGSCPKCGSRRLLMVREMYNHTAEHVAPLPLCLSPSLPEQPAGGFETIVCCGCRYTEWYARHLDEVIKELGRLGVAHVRDADFEERVESLGLSPVARPARGDWQFLAQGVYDGAQVTIGQRAHPRLVAGEIQNVVRIELVAGARADLGGYVVRRPTAVGWEPHVPLGQVARKGDPEFDSFFNLVLTAQLAGQTGAAPSAGTLPPVVVVPWLDDVVREHLLAVRPEEMLVANRTVGLLLLDYMPQQFSRALELAVYLAKWRGPQDHPYR